MSYDNVYSKIYKDLLTIDGKFNMKNVMMTAFIDCPNDYTKKQIKELALQVLDDSLNNGMIKMVDDGIYESIFSKERQM